MSHSVPMQLKHTCDQSPPNPTKKDSEHMNANNEPRYVKKSEHKKRVPLDTLGHPLPPPVRAEEVCRIPRKLWEKWWIDFYNDKFVKELDCSVCGLSFPEPTLIPLKRAVIDREIQRKVLNTPGSNVRLCQSCKAACGVCGCAIVTEQKKRHNGVCQACIEEEKLLRKKRKIPSGR